MRLHKFSDLFDIYGFRTIKNVWLITYLIFPALLPYVLNLYKYKIYG